MLAKLTLHRWALVFLIIVSPLLTFAQRTITGTVTTSNNEPAAGATVTVTGTNVGTQTAPTGTFSITIPQGRNSLTISYVGFEIQTVTVGNQASVTVLLQPSSSALSEVVVTGYSAQRRKDITGSVSVVKAEDLKSIPAGNAEVQLQGRAPGVTVITSNQPGDGAAVRIRGLSSLGGGGATNNPLFIIDGVPAGGLGSISSEDIESLQVLKDAASASIYGSRASNGVVVVTTKKGKNGPVKLSYDFYYGTQSPRKNFDLLNSREYADLVFLAYKNSGQALTGTLASLYGTGASPVLPDYILPTGAKEGDPAVDPSKYFLNYDNIGGSYLISRANKLGTNWYDELTRNAPIQRHGLSVSGANDKTRYLFSATYFDQQGIIINNFSKRYSVRANTEFKVRNNFRIGENLQLLYQQDGARITNNDEGNVIAYSYRSQPIIPVYDIMGNFAGSRGGIGNSFNPVAQRIRAQYDRGNTYNIFGNVYAELDLLKHFTARTNFGGQINLGNSYYNSFPSYENQENSVLNAFTEANNTYRAWNWTNQVTYKNTFGAHSVNAFVGSEAFLEDSRGSEARRQGYFSNALAFRTLSAGSGAQSASGAPNIQRSLYSLFAQANYSYNDKYLLSATVRRDGASAFGVDKRYVTFPAFSLGWRISEESFFRDISWINDLKIRGSWGKMGNQGISAANQFTQFSGSNGSSFYDIGGTGNTLAQGFYLSFIGNSRGGWETNTTTDLGFDATLFKGKTEIIFDVYSKKTSNLLYAAEQLGNSGTSAANNPPAFNLGSMKNTGIDLGITQRGNIGGANGVKFDATLTFTSYKNSITNISDTTLKFYDVQASTEQNRIGGYFVRNQVGQPLSSYYGYKVIGLFQSEGDIAKSAKQIDAKPGRFKYMDRDGNDTITDADKTFLGSPNPAFTYGFNVNASYKGFDLGLYFYGVQGREAINYTKWFTDFYPSFAGGKSKRALYESWLPTRTNTTVPIAEANGGTSAFSTTGQINSYYVENASYLRLKNLTLGYTLPKALLRRFSIERLRVYIQGTNLFTKTKYSGLDPEVIGNDQGSGVDIGAYPTVRTYLIGLNLNF
jgi:TonB-linked SusC/RagA family outer membrane protein